MSCHASDPCAPPSSDTEPGIAMTISANRVNELFQAQVMNQVINQRLTNEVIRWWHIEKAGKGKAEWSTLPSPSTIISQGTQTRLNARKTSPARTQLYREHDTLFRDTLAGSSLPRALDEQGARES